MTNPKQKEARYFAYSKTDVWGLGQTREEALADGLKWQKSYYTDEKDMPELIVDVIPFGLERFLEENGGEDALAEFGKRYEEAMKTRGAKWR